MFPQPDEDMHNELRLTREERDIAQDALREADERLGQAAAIIAKQQDRIGFLESILLDMGAWLTTAMERKR